MVRLFSLVLVLASVYARADILFEGYSKIYSGGLHVGFTVNRYEFDRAKKQFISTSFIKTNSVGGDLTESLKAYAKEDMTPLSYQYTNVVQNMTKTIDAKFVGNKINATIIEKTLPLDPQGKVIATAKPQQKIERISKEVPAKTFLSTFLAYVMLKSPQGFQKDIKFEYKAVAEEDATIVSGMAYIKDVKEENKIKLFQVLNEFKNIRYMSMVSERGEVFSTKNPVQGITTELVAQPSQATGNIPVPAVILKALFGQVPTGQNNDVSKNYHNQQIKQPATSTVTTTLPSSSKEMGIPQGKGIMIKGNSQNENQ